jgi:antitoxin VapB
MLNLPPEATRLAERLAAAYGVSVDEAILRAIELGARAAGIGVDVHRRRQTAAEMCAVGAEIAAMPLLDPRSPRVIMDDLNGP